MSSADAVLEFWFGKPGDPWFGKQRELWFKVDPEFDTLFRDRFMGLHKQAAEGELDLWVESPRACLALILLLDQFPRNAFRNMAEAFETDPKARWAAMAAIEREHDMSLSPVERSFVYLPFEHSENLADQQHAVRLFENLERETSTKGLLSYAKSHLKVIERFGRFPHRNAIVGRQSTPEELAFLRDEWKGF